MDPEAIEPGDAVRIRPASRTVFARGTILAHIVSIHDNVYVLYLRENDVFIELSRDALLMIVLRENSTTNDIRWDWMCAYVAALDMGTKKLQDEVEALLRDTESREPGRWSYSTFGDVEPITEITTYHESTLLHVAASRGKHKAAEWLLDPTNIHKIDVNVLDRYSGSPLRGACYRSHLSMCKLLLERGANPNHGLGVALDALTDASKILMLYGGNKYHVAVTKTLGLPHVANILTRVLCSHAPISRLPADILRTYVLPLVGVSNDGLGWEYT
jgi:hypothetical protein